MLKTTNGDLFTGIDGNSIIAHGCNAQGKMNSGFAKELRERYSYGYDAYIASVNGPSRHMMGHVIWANNPQVNGLPIIANCITQEFYGNNPHALYVNYGAIEKSLKYVAEEGSRLRSKIHLPLIGGGLANGDRGYLIKLFEYVFYHNDATLWIKD